MHLARPQPFLGPAQTSVGGHKPPATLPHPWGSVLPAVRQSWQLPSPATRPAAPRQRRHCSLSAQPASPRYCRGLSLQQVRWVDLPEPPLPPPQLSAAPAAPPVLQKLICCAVSMPVPGTPRCLRPGCPRVAPRYSHPRTPTLHPASPPRSSTGPPRQAGAPAPTPSPSTVQALSRAAPAVCPGRQSRPDASRPQGPGPTASVSPSPGL